MQPPGRMGGPGPIPAAPVEAACDDRQAHCSAQRARAGPAVGPRGCSRQRWFGPADSAFTRVNVRICVTRFGTIETTGYKAHALVKLGRIATTMMAVSAVPTN